MESEKDPSSTTSLRLVAQEPLSEAPAEKENTTAALRGKETNIDDGKGKWRPNEKKRTPRKGRGKGEQGLSDNTNVQKKSNKPHSRNNKTIASLFVSQIVEGSISHLTRLASNEYHSANTLKDLSRGLPSPNEYLPVRLHSNK